MSIEVSKVNEIYEIPLQSIIQLCGEDIEKKEYICHSLEKFFSSSKYEEWEEIYRNNIRIDGEDVGRQYFRSVVIKSREDIIKILRISPKSMMRKYIEYQYINFEYQVIFEQISNMLDMIFMNFNLKFKNRFENLEVGYERNKMLDLLFSAEVYGDEEKTLETLSNYELLSSFIELLWEIQRIDPHRTLIIIKNIDHMISLREYQQLIKNINNDLQDFENYWLFTSSIRNYVVVNEQNVEGICVVNQDIYNFPDMEHIKSFVKENYPLEMNWEDKQVYKCIQGMVHKLGNEKEEINLQENVIFKMFQDTLCIKTVLCEEINEIEMEYLRR